jgi:phosphogluconate dehydratase
VFLPSGPMTSGFSNDDRKHLRREFEKGLVTVEELIEVESKSFHETVCGSTRMQES